MFGTCFSLVFYVLPRCDLMRARASRFALCKKDPRAKCIQASRRLLPVLTHISATAVDIAATPQPQTRTENRPFSVDVEGEKKDLEAAVT